MLKMVGRESTLANLRNDPVFWSKFKVKSRELILKVENITLLESRDFLLVGLSEDEGMILTKK